MKRVLTTLLKSVCIIALVLCGMDAQAQGNLVTGAVRDAKGEPVIGATVIVKGTATGATSGADGRYSIQAGPDATLEFSFIGYKKQEVPVGTRSAIDVVLEEDALMVDDVVVIGYGTQSRRTITAAVSKVDGEKLAGAPVNSIGDALKGRVGGVRVSSADNQPGSDPVFLIRGGSSINQSNAPIIIIDGVNREMTGLNPNDIESIEVLKDAASAGIYGARASNGVILITTKKGSMARGPQVTFEAQAAWTSPAVRFDLMNGGDYLRTMRTMLNEYPSTYAYGSGILTGANSAGIGNGDNSVWTPKFVDTPADVPAGWKVMVDPIDHSKLIAYQDNDQQKQWFDDSYWMNYYVGVNGGNDKVQYAASAGYTKDGGIGINTDFSRFTFHGNTSFKILRNLKATTVFDYSETKGNTLPSSGIATYWTTVGRGMFMPATHRDYLDDGTPAQGTNNTTISAAWFDRYYTSNYTARRMTANFNLEWEIVDGLRAVMQVANHNYYRIDNQRLAGNAISNQRRTYEKWGQTNRFSTQGYLNYRKTFAQDHAIDAPHEEQRKQQQQLFLGEFPAQLLERRIHVVFHRARRNAQLLSDLAVRKVFDVAQTEHFAAFGRQRLDGRIEAGAQVVVVEFLHDGAVVGCIVRTAQRGDALPVVGAVFAGAPVLVQVVERAVVDRTQQVLVQRVRIVERLPPLPYVVEHVLHHILGPVVSEEQAGVGNQHGIIFPAQFVERLAVTRANP